MSLRPLNCWDKKRQVTRYLKAETTGNDSLEAIRNGSEARVYRSQFRSPEHQVGFKQAIIGKQFLKQLRISSRFDASRSTKHDKQTLFTWVPPFAAG